MRNCWVLLICLLLTPANAPSQSHGCSRAIRVAIAKTLRGLRPETSEKREQALIRFEAFLKEMEDDLQEVSPQVARMYAISRESNRQNLYVTRDLMAGLERYFVEHGETLSQWAKEMAELILGMTPRTDESAIRWGEMQFPPKPRRMQSPDLFGMRQHIIETSKAEDLDVVAYLEFTDEIARGLPHLIEQTYHGAIHHHLDRLLHRGHSDFQRRRALRLRQRHQTIPTAIFFISPLPEQQNFWAEELTKDRWRNVPRLYVVDKWEHGSFVTNPKFRDQIDLARVDLLLSREQGLSARIENLVIVGSQLEPTFIADLVEFLRSRISLPGDALMVNVVDLRVGRRNDYQHGNVFSFHDELDAMDDENFQNVLTEFAEKLIRITDNKDSVHYWFRRGNPVELEVQGLESGPLQVLFYSFDGKSGK